MPIPNGPVQQPNFHDPAFQQNGQQAQNGQRQAPTMQGVPPTIQQFEGGAVQMPAPTFPAPQPQQQPGFVQVGQDPQGRPIYQQVQQQAQPAQQIPNQQNWQGQQPQQRSTQQQLDRQSSQYLQPQQGAQVNIDAQGRLSGPGVPPELQGRTLAEGLNSYGMMRQVAMQMAAGQRPQVPGQMPPQQQPYSQQVQQPQAQTPAQQVGAAAQPKSFWADPEGAIQRIVDDRLAPVTQQTQLQAVQGARDTVAAQFPQFAQYEGLVIQKMQGLDPRILANPKAWEIAFQQVVGEVALNGGRFPAGGQQPVAQPANNGWQPYTQGQQGAPGGPRLGDFFTEAPGAGFAGNGAADGTFGLNPAQQEVARRMNLTNEQYARGAGMIP